MNCEQIEYRRKCRITLGTLQDLKLGKHKFFDSYQNLRAAANCLATKKRQQFFRITKQLSHNVAAVQTMSRGQREQDEREQSAIHKRIVPGCKDTLPRANSLN